MSQTVEIVKTPDVLHGKPRVKGTRIGVFMLGESIREGDQTIEELLAGYPDLTRDGIEAALSYYDDHPDEMETLRARREAHYRAVQRNSRAPDA
ncbi:DUF433 domain-containing protein [Halobacteriales archaeon QH_6_64_20]|jgi:uncharacterized protein (DUF433 family)|nr:MAG: DUF433 domain-containing protein [Halobacteriales archaeon QH_6_64_20]